VVYTCVGRQLEQSSDNIAMPLRMIEIYTDPATYMSSDDPVTYITSSDPVTSMSSDDPVTYITSSDPVTYMSSDDPVTYMTSTSSDPLTCVNSSTSNDIVCTVVQHLINNGQSASFVSVSLHCLFVLYVCLCLSVCLSVCVPVWSVRPSVCASVSVCLMYQDFNTCCCFCF